MRLDKYLASCGLGSRTVVKQLLKKKQITVNDECITSAKHQVNPEIDTVKHQGISLIYQEFVYYMLNKPAGLLSATEDKQQKTVLDLIESKDKHHSLFPVGRLDKDTTGLLLLTNNGQLAHAMLSPKKHVDKVYQASVSGIMTDEDVRDFASGMTLSDFTAKPASLRILQVDEDQNECLVEITLSEGKFHQVKRMVAACAKEVISLKRVGMGPLVLDNSLSEGAYRPLKAEELESLAAFGVGL
ncbi:pseudouridine synthase [Streptococcus sp. zg-JUN1979]|uniref:pseudouridine synthase n=1 Tax=Streptococcus sp. zg-JUN1979 TaxID=3391450 RepID=UPI0039A42476